jgi:hypothetical protein
VTSVGLPLVPTPPEVLVGLDAVPVPGSAPASYDVVVPLWTAEGPAGLGVEIRLVPTPWKTFDVEVLGVRAVDIAAHPRSPTVPQPGATTGRPGLPGGRPTARRSRCAGSRC